MATGDNVASELAIAELEGELAQAGAHLLGLREERVEMADLLELRGRHLPLRRGGLQPGEQVDHRVVQLGRGREARARHERGTFLLFGISVLARRG